MWKGGQNASRDFKTFLDDEVFLAIPDTRATLVCVHHGVQTGPVRGGCRSASRDFKDFLDDEAFLAIPDTRATLVFLVAPRSPSPATRSSVPALCGGGRSANLAFKTSLDDEAFLVIPETREPSPAMRSSPQRAIVSPVRPPDPAAGVGGSMEECGDAMDEDGGSMDGWGDVMEEQDDAVGRDEATKPVPRTLKHAMDEEEEEIEGSIEEDAVRWGVAIKPAPRSLEHARPSSNTASGSGTSSS